MGFTFKNKLRTLMFLLLVLLTLVLSGCGDDPKSLVRSSLDDKSGAKISEVYNKKKDDEKSKFAKEVTIAYFEQAKADLSRKNNPSYTQYFYDTLTDLFKHIDSNDKNFTNLRILQQLMQTRESKIEERGRLRDQLGLSLDNGRLNYSNAGPIRQYTLYIFHKVFSTDYNPLYAAVEAREYGNEYTGSMVMPSPNDYVAVVHVPRDGVFAEGSGLYTFYAAQAGNYKFTDAGGFERNVPLLQFVFDGQVEMVRRFVRLSKERDNLLKNIIPNYVNNVLADPGGEFKTGVASIDRQIINGSAPVGSVPVGGGPVRPVSKATFTSTQSSFDNEDGYHHDAAKAIDGNSKSCWAEGVKGLGIGENITINFDGVFQVSGFDIWIGHQKSEDLFYKNARPTKINISGSDGYSRSFYLSDKFGMQRINLGTPINTQYVKITVEEAAPGSKYEDTCISEVRFF